MLVLLLAGFGIEGRDGALAVAYGCGIAILPNAYFTLQAFRYRASQQPAKAFGAIYWGETGKIVLVMVLCALVFRFVPPHYPLLLFVALFVMLAIQVPISMKVFSRQMSSGSDTTQRSNDAEID